MQNDWHINESDFHCCKNDKIKIILLLSFLKSRKNFAIF